MLHKSTQHSTIGYVTDGSVTAFAAGRAPDDAGRAQSGTARMVLVTGDRADIAVTIGRIVGFAAVYPDRDPAEKLAIVRAGESAPTIMVGDGVNDAPAPAAAGVGVAWPPAGRPRRPRWLMWCSPRTG
jgi:magnesium-transporting ATPase (P-type)